MEDRTQTIEAGQHVKEVYTPYAMSTIVDRALPDVKDGLKPIHRRILFSSYEEGITDEKERAKTVELVSETLKIHHHGNTSVEEAIALMTEQNDSQLHPYIDGEGAFGKCYSTDSPTPPRYTYCRLNKFAEEFFIDYDKGILSMTGEDKDHLQPITLSASFPNILVKTNTGIACGESCNFPSFNLKEVCDTTIEYVKDKNIDLLKYLYAPDFASKGYLIYNDKQLKEIYETGKGSIVLRGKYKYDEGNNCIDIYEIPYTTTADAIIAKIHDLMKSGKIPIIKSILDVRDETGFNDITQREELKITVDLKKNTNINSLMQILLKKTPLESTFSANMNCLVDCEPKVLGIKQILDKWLKFRKKCIINGLNKDLEIKTKKLKYLRGLEKILLDTNKAIKIIKESVENMISKNLSEFFDIELEHAEVISNMRLRNINTIFINKQIINIPILEKEIENINFTLDSEDEINKVIIKDLERVESTYGKERLTEILYEEPTQEISKTDLIEDYSTYCMLTQEGYLKKLLKKTTDVKLKEGDSIIYQTYSSNKSTLLLFSDKNICYKIYQYELEECKPSSHGEYLQNLLSLSEGEKIIAMVSTKDDYNGELINIYDNGNIAKVKMESFKTKTKRSKLDNALYDGANLLQMINTEVDIDVLMVSGEGRGLIVNTSRINSKGSKNTQGATAMNICSKFENNKIVDCIVNVTSDDKFTLYTEKGKEETVKLKDIVPTGKSNEQRNMFKYISGNLRNSGSFIYNCRAKNDRIIKMIKSQD